MALTFHSQYAGRVGIEMALHPPTSVLSYTATLTTGLPAPRIYSFVLPITNPITHAGSCH